MNHKYKVFKYLKIYRNKVKASIHYCIRNCIKKKDIFPIMS